MLNISSCLCFTSQERCSIRIPEQAKAPLLEVSPSLEFGLYLFIYLINTSGCCFRMANGLWFVFSLWSSRWGASLPSEGATQPERFVSTLCCFPESLKHLCSCPGTCQWHCAAVALHLFTPEPALQVWLTFTGYLGWIQGSWTWALQVISQTTTSTAFHRLSLSVHRWFFIPRLKPN